MRKMIALLLGIFLPVLGASGVGQAQSTSAVQVQGVIEGVDCQSGMVQLSSASGTSTIYAAPYTTTLIGTTSIPLCGLKAYVGAPVTAWLVADANQFSATQIVVTGPVATAPAPAASISPVPIVGVVLGTIVAAGVVYLLVHGPDGGYYRYPYYGSYYRFYYHAGYRPYTGYYPGTAPVITVAPVIAGIVLGIIIVNNYQYILTRDGSGHYYRYPYYGPYHQYYYRSTYRTYTGSYRAYQDAPVRQGDPHWDAQARNVAQMHTVTQFRSSGAARNTTQPAARRVTPVQPSVQQTHPTHQPAARPATPVQPSVQQAHPTYQPAARPATPVQPSVQQAHPTYQPAARP
ncbi:MAG TPA: hypothetical protein VKX16_04355, partial [Chloroflexota bacterium]|nr:hypothetical protein [Chloroflexota bacterium]